MEEKTTEHAKDETIPKKVRLTRFSLLVERLARAFWPAAALFISLAALVALGFAELVDAYVALAVIAIGAAAGVFLLYRGVRAFRWPSRADAINRLDEPLRGAPLATLSDTQALGADDVGSQAVWSAHLDRMRRLAAEARAPRPDPQLASADPYALRLVALVLLIAAGLFARSDGFEAVTALRTPGAEAAPAGPAFEGWAEPPRYTGRPTLYLPEVAAGDTLSVPSGTIVTLRAYGDADRFEINESISADANTSLTEPSEGLLSGEMIVARDGELALLERGETLRSWRFSVETDSPPEVELVAPVDRTVAGEMQLEFVARDDYGVTAGEASISLDFDNLDRRYGLVVEPEPRDPIVVDLPLPLTGAVEETTETLVEDFTGHPWVGLPVIIELKAVDAIDQVGLLSGVTTELPGRRFYNATAAALVEQRRDLLWSAQNGARVLQSLRAVGHYPETAFDNTSAYLIVRTATRRLATAVRSEDVAGSREEITEALWRAALLLEEGSLGDAAERLARAKERLAEALRDDSTTDEEIAELMEELREATRDYMEQMAREAIERGENQRAEAPPPGQSMSQDQIQQLMDRIQELSEQGRRAEAEALLEQLQQLLENMEMQFAEGAQGQGQGQQSQGQQMMDELGQALRQQQGLADESFQRLQEQFRDGQMGGNGQGEPNGQDPEGQPSQPGGGDDLADRQEALRELMEELQRQMPGVAGEGTRQSLEEAERNMGEARDDLREGQTAEALDRQAEAIDNLRDGLQQMAEDMRQAQGDTPGEGQQSGEVNPDGQRDPFGRETGTRGQIGSETDMLPGADAAARARQLLDEIRRRSGEQMRPQIELEYLRRLLDRF